MNKNSMRKFAVAIAFAMVLSSLLVMQAFANEIKVFAPLNYAGVPPSFPLPFNPWGTFATPATSSALVNPPDGSTTLSAVPSGNVSGLAMSWFDTGWHNYTGPIQPGAVHSDTWLNYRIAGWGAGFFAFLWVFEYDPIAGTFQYWTKTAFDGLPGARHNAFDLGIIPGDVSNTGNLFMWTTGRWYYSRVLLLSFASVGTTAVANGKFEDILYIAYLSSPQDHWDALNPQPLPPSHVQPVLGPAGMMAEVDGEGFNANDAVQLFVDGQLAGQSQVDGAGKYAIVFPLAGRPGAHFVKTMDDHGNQAFSFFDVFTEAGPIVGDVNGDGQVDIFDAIMVAQNFGRTDPAMVQPGPAQQVTLGLSTFAVALAIPLVTNELLRRTHKKSKPRT